MDPLAFAGYATNIVFTWLAWRVSRRDPGHRWLAAYVVWMFATDWVRFGLDALRAGASRPYTGFARLVFHVDQTIVLSWNFLFLALVAHYFVRAKPWIFLGAWAATFAICLNYPRISGPTLIGLYQIVSLGSLFVSWALILWGILRGKPQRPTLAHLVVVLYACTDVVVNLVPFARGMIANWPLVQLAYLLNYAVCVVLHVVRLGARPAGATA